MAWHNAKYKYNAPVISPVKMSPKKKYRKNNLAPTILCYIYFIAMKDFVQFIVLKKLLTIKTSFILLSNSLDCTEILTKL